ncbi:inositol-1-monophosphatase [Gracilibacillus boraciitolerans JCM 21714]|uniref:inositol-phosphate phosphatase n=1 Tax=Gracilibacillus boraciitolerans JCM 21714 TaxID=1298598 RepID=W4VG52_9BACI|nr:inositol monophosphatase family protein [Gracilibacillus boraciitolerans]GAE91793.1 inositol-1-monophosphatase [Gracilibacillus boraciitolerans JCM 21714]
MDKTIRQQIYSDVKKWIYQAGGEQIRVQIDDKYQIDTKSSANDLVTEVDRETEKFFAEKIRDKYPSHRIVGEEGYGDKVDTLDGTIWIIDPIDGTMNFVHQKRNFAISIGIYHDGIGGEIGLIYNVMEDVLYTGIRGGEGAFRNNEKLPQLTEQVSIDTSIIALNSSMAFDNNRINEKKVQQLIMDIRGTRSYGSAALEFAYVAEGIVDAYVTMRLAPWDIAAGLILVNEVGGITVQANGQSVDLLGTNAILTCNKCIKEELLENYIELK